jgi:hypothetical protein
MRLYFGWETIIGRLVHRMIRQTIESRHSDALPHGGRPRGLTAIPLYQVNIGPVPEIVGVNEKYKIRAPGTEAACKPAPRLKNARTCFAYAAFGESLLE